MNTVEPIRDLSKVVAIKRMLKRKSPRDYLLFTLGINTALRISDILRLKVSDIMDENGQIKDFLYVRQKKTNKEARIKINESLKEAIEFYLDQAHPQSSQYLFTSRTGKPLDRTHVWRMVNHWARAVGITDPVGCHTLRKTWGYWARKRGVPLELIQAKFGHSSPAVTRRYIGITADEIEDIENQINL